jgi:hypothetical protein
LLSLDKGSSISSIQRVISEEDPKNEKKELDVDTDGNTNS